MYVCEYEWVYCVHATIDSHSRYKCMRIWMKSGLSKIIILCVCVCMSVFC